MEVSGVHTVHKRSACALPSRRTHLLADARRRDIPWAARPATFSRSQRELLLRHELFANTTATKDCASRKQDQGCRAGLRCDGHLIELKIQRSNSRGSEKSGYLGDMRRIKRWGRGSGELAQRHGKMLCPRPNQVIKGLHVGIPTADECQTEFNRGRRRAGKIQLEETVVGKIGAEIDRGRWRVKVSQLTDGIRRARDHEGSSRHLRAERIRRANVQIDGKRREPMNESATLSEPETEDPSAVVSVAAAEPTLNPSMLRFEAELHAPGTVQRTAMNKTMTRGRPIFGRSLAISVSIIPLERFPVCIPPLSAAKENKLVIVPAGGAPRAVYFQGSG